MVLDACGSGWMVSEDPGSRPTLLTVAAGLQGQRDR